MRKTIAACAITALAIGGTTATAASLITSKDIADGSIQNRDIHEGAVSYNRLTPGLRALLAQVGEPGKDGANGVNGKDGARGANGKDGDKGAKGDKGEKGDAGEKGEQGEVGATGATGPQGPQGEKGDKGDTGATGPQGVKGDKGDPGADGLNSDTPREVTASNMRGWTFAPKGDNGDTTDNGTLTFDVAPVAAPLGSKALKMVATTGKPVVAYLPLPAGTAAAFLPGSHPKLSELTTAGYSSLSNATPADTIDVSFQTEVLKANVGSLSGYTTVVYEPYQNGQNATPDAFQRHNVRTGKVWATRAVTGAVAGECSQANPCTVSRFIELNPDATVQTAKLRIGQNSGAGWDSFVGYVDDVRLGFDGESVRYDLGA